MAAGQAQAQTLVLQGLLPVPGGAPAPMYLAPINPNRNGRISARGPPY